jgi:hypothetical protein
MTNWQQFETLSDLEEYLLSELDYNVSLQENVYDILFRDGIRHRLQVQNESNSDQWESLFSWNDECDSVIECTMKVTRKYWLWFTTEFIWIIRFHFSKLHTT